MPKVSVIMAAFNEEQHIRRSICSILNQTFRDFELIVIDDGSTDRTAKIIKNINDRRIVYIHNELNLGLTKSLNRGLDIASGQLIARMDADDFALPARLDRQVAEFSRKNIEICGTWGAVKFKGVSVVKKYKPPILNDDIIRRMSVANPLIHSSVMLDRMKIGCNLRYNEFFNVFEDYELWVKLAKVGFKFYNIPEYLVIRFEDNNLTSRPIYRGMTGFRRMLLASRIHLKGQCLGQGPLPIGLCKEGLRAGRSMLRSIPRMLSKER